MQIVAGVGAQTRDVEREGQESALVLAGLAAVHEDPAPLVDRTEVQQCAVLAETGGQVEGSLVVQVLAGLQLPLHAGQGCLGGEGDHDRSVPVMRTSRRDPERVLPDAVEVEVGVAPQLRTRMFRQGVLAVQLLTPRGQQDPPGRHHDGSRRRRAWTGITMSRMTIAAATKMPGVGTCLS